MAIDITKVARTISMIENNNPEAETFLKQAYSQNNHVPIVGIVGPPGAGKSTLVDKIATHWAECGETVAILAVDPASPFTGGAVLGDRFRMKDASQHPNIYVRSLSSRGELGGLSRAATDVAIAMGVLGFDRVLIETVGSGQNDVDIGTLADCVVVVAVPGMGDEVQASKAGILEIGDIYAVNKVDTTGAEIVVSQLSSNIDLIYPGRPGSNEPTESSPYCVGNAEIIRRHGSHRENYWRPPVNKVSGAKDIGINELANFVDQFLKWQTDNGRQEMRIIERISAQIRRIAKRKFLVLCDLKVEENGGWEKLTKAALTEKKTPEMIAQELLSEVFERCTPMSFY